MKRKIQALLAALVAGSSLAWMLDLPRERRVLVAEEFSSASLGALWRTSPGEGRLTLSERPGSLRYRLEGATNPGDSLSEKLATTFLGDRWDLESAIEFDLPRGSGRQLTLRVDWGGGRSLEIARTHDIGDAPHRGHSDWIAAQFAEPGLASPILTRQEVDAPGSASRLRTGPNGRLSIQIERRRQTVRLLLAENGQPYREVLKRAFLTPLGGSQSVRFSGAAFSGDWGGAADLDYLRVHTTASQRDLSGGAALAFAGLMLLLSDTVLRRLGRATRRLAARRYAREDERRFWSEVRRNLDRQAPSHGEASNLVGAMSATGVETEADSLDEGSRTAVAMLASGEASVKRNSASS